jgi:cell division septation protein DedD
MNYKYLVIASVLSALASPLPAQSVKAGIEAWQKSDYSAAVAIWRPLAENGDADAAFNLGQAYRLGRGVPTNLGAAQSWFERAARKGHVDAQTTLGLLLFQNGNQTAGMRWLKGAAEKGDPRALLVYGTALFNGDAVSQDPVLGYAYVSRAAAQGLVPAKETLAQMDQVLPLEDRKKGAALALAKAKAQAPPAATAERKPAAAKPVPAKPGPKPPKPVQTASIKPKPAPATPVALSTKAAKGTWRVQLGAFSQRGSAEALYRKLSANGALAGRQAFYVPAGVVTRLQVGPFESRAAAQAACSALKGQACFPVGAK